MHPPKKFSAKNLGLTTVLLATVFLSKLVFAQQNTTGPMVKSNNTQKISEHVYVIPDDSVPGVPNVGIIVGETGTLIIDTGMGKANGLIILEEAKKISADNQLYLVTTHVHPEHDLGAHAFPESTRMIRAQKQIDEIAETGLRTAEAFSSRSETNRKLLEGATFRKADIVFEDEYSLDLGGLSVQLFAMGPNHTLGDTVTLVVDDNIVFSGDVVMKALPAFASSKSSVSSWLDSLNKIEKFEPRTIVPSHGPMGDMSLVNNYRRFLTAVVGRTTALKKENKSLEEITLIVSTELEREFGFGSSRRIAGAVRAAYNEANPG